MLSMLMEPFILNRAETSVLKLLLILLICIGASSCNERSKLRKTMTDFMGSVIVIPDDLECISNRSIENISIEDLAHPEGTPDHWLKFGSYISPVAPLSERYLYIDTQSSEIFALTGDKTIHIAQSWETLDSCLCDIYSQLESAC